MDALLDSALDTAQQAGRKSGAVEAVEAQSSFPDEDYVDRIKNAFLRKHSQALVELEQLTAEQDAMWEDLAKEIAPGNEPPSDWVSAEVELVPELAEDEEEESGESEDDEDEACQRLNAVLTQPKWKL
uniref:Uncharacterized protein n=1 Tax=Chrysotila carterae TaxID=13221 RepID=A0A7S4B0Z0_CHRCT